MTTRVEWVETTCGCGCGVTFRQLRDPGREREYLNNAHKQRAYRARNPHKSHSGSRPESESARRRREQEEAWAREEARKERDRQRKARARGTSWKVNGVPDWCFPRAGEDPLHAKKRRWAKLLYERHLRPLNDQDHEATNARVMADKLRADYGL